MLTKFVAAGMLDGCFRIEIPGFREHATEKSMNAGATRFLGKGFVDVYSCFKDLARYEKEGKDFRIEWRRGRTGLTVMAPHGGGIEPGTSEVARAVAGEEHSFYHLDGLKKTKNRILHLTSTRFDEPIALDLARTSWKVVTIHGCDGFDPVVYVGGLDGQLIERCQRQLEAEGFRTEIHPVFRGDQPANLCNRCMSGKGLQLELSLKLRKSFFRGLSRPERGYPTDRFHRFVAVLRAVLSPSADWKPSIQRSPESLGKRSS